MSRPRTRREFLATGAAAAVVTGMPSVRRAESSEAPIRIGVVGSGGRGTGACANALEADPAVELVGMADIGMDRMTLSLERLRRAADRVGFDPARIKVTEQTMFAGPDAFRAVMDLDLDYVILATPPGFRPLHYAEAVDRGLHAFVEKPVGTDPVGVRAIRKTAEKAKEKGLSTVVGLNYRHDTRTMDTVKRIHEGALGRVTSGTIHRMGGELWYRGDDPSWSPMEYQCRNWYYYCWLGGDQIVEMLVHQIDLMNWALQSTPIRALAQGGRLVRTDAKWGNIYDHMSVTYEYPNDVQVNLMCRQWDGCANRNENRVIGTLGESDSQRKILGENAWEAEEDDDPLKQATVYEHIELIKSIRAGDARNDILDFAADGTLTAILGRESAYTGQVVTWDEIQSSDLNLFPESYQFGPAPHRPLPMPGKPRLG